MITVKFFIEKKERSDEALKTTENIENYINEKFGKANIIKDNSCIEISSGNNIFESDLVEIEINYNDKVFINKKDFSNKDKVDKIVKKVKFICDKIKDIDEFKYKSIF